MEDEKIDFKKINALNGFKGKQDKYLCVFDFQGMGVDKQYVDNLDNILSAMRTGDEFIETFSKIIDIYQRGDFNGLFPEKCREKPLVIGTKTYNQFRLWHGFPGGPIYEGHANSMGHGLAVGIYGKTARLDALIDDLKWILPFMEKPKAILQTRNDQVEVYASIPISIALLHAKSGNNFFPGRYDIRGLNAKWDKDHYERVFFQG